MKQQTKLEFVKSVINDIDEDLSNEEIIHLVLDRKISEHAKRENTAGQRAADVFAKFVGSWTFIIGFIILLSAWLVLNILLAVKAFDPYPFILLNLVLSCVAAIQAPLIMISQNRESEKDRERAENDYKVNLKTEIIIEDLHIKLDQIIKELDEIKGKKEKTVQVIPHNQKGK